MKEEKKSKVIRTLDYLYDKSMKGVPGLASVVEEADDYLNEYENKEESINQILSTQLTKSGTSGFLTNVLGAFTFPIAMTTNIASTLYVQMRTVLMIAYINGFDIKKESVKSFVYLCLCGKKAISIANEMGIDCEYGLEKEVMENVPSELVTRIKDAVIHELIGKLSVHGVGDFMQMVPVAGGIIGASFNVRNTKAVATVAKQLFITYI